MVISNPLLNYQKRIGIANKPSLNKQRNFKRTHDMKLNHQDHFKFEHNSIDLKDAEVLDAYVFGGMNHFVMKRRSP